jgi:hypothetical protein
MNLKPVRAAGAHQIWSESYEDQAANASLLEARVALEVTHQVSAHLTAETAARLSSGVPARPTAYDAYLHGRY